MTSRLVSSRLLATFSRRTARCVVVATKSEPRGGCHLYVLCRLIAVERLRLISIKILRKKTYFGKKNVYRKGSCGRSLFGGEFPSIAFTLH